MDRSKIIKKFRKQVQSIWMLDSIDWSDQRFINWVEKTRLYLIEVFPSKADEHIRKERISMFDKAVNKMPSHEFSSIDSDFDRKVHQAKLWLQWLLRNFIELLEEKLDDNWKKWNNNLKISIDNTQFNTQKIDISQVIKNVLNIVEKSENIDDKEEAKEKISELEKELKKKKWDKNWDKIKWILKRLLDFSRDAFITLLPAIWEYYIH